MVAVEGVIAVMAFVIESIAAFACNANYGHCSVDFLCVCNLKLSQL